MAEITLVKGQKIDLKKSNGSSLTNMCLGLNWGMIETKGFFGGVSKESVDLDASCAIFDSGKNLLDVVYFGQKLSKDGAIKHSGDDLSGDADGDDGTDNEILMVDLLKVSPQADQIVFILNSYKGQDFATIPYARIRIFEGDFQKVNNVVAQLDIAKDKKFSGYVSMVMGKLYKRNNEWKFSAIGEPTTDKRLQDTIVTIHNKYL